MFFTSPAVKKHLCFPPDKNALRCPFSHIYLNEHTCTRLTDVCRACLHVRGNELFVLHDRGQNDGSFFFHSQKVIASHSGVMPVWDTVCVITDRFLYGERCSGCCVIWLCLVYSRICFLVYLATVS